MAERTIQLDEDAYQTLVGMKRPGESLSDLVRRLTRRRSLTELGSVLPRPAAAAIRDAVAENRKERHRARRKTLGLD